MKIAVIGSRTFQDKELLYKVLNELPYLPSVIVSGGAKGADSLAECWAKSKGVELLILTPEYYKYPGNPKVAPLMRNLSIVDNSDKVIVFWDGKSKGSQQAIAYANKTGKEVTIIKFNNSLQNSKETILQQNKINF